MLHLPWELLELMWPPTLSSMTHHHEASPVGQECPQLHLKVPPVPVDDMVNIISMAVWKRMKDVSDAAGGTVSGPGQPIKKENR